MTPDPMDESEQAHLDNEWYVVRHSGEIPEIALHSAIYYLTEAEDGPGLKLSQKQRSFLQKAAVERFHEIILRDLIHDNKDLPIYRGLQRTIFNYNRFLNFCNRQQIASGSFASDVAAALMLFLVSEQVCVCRQQRSSIINCSFSELNAFARQVGLVKERLPDEYSDLCLPDTTG